MPSGYNKNGINKGQFKKGSKLSDEIKEKIRLSHIGKKHPHSEETKIKIGHSNTGKRCSEEKKKKLRDANKGEKSYRWKGGITKNKKYLSWLKNKRNRLKDATKKELGSHSFGEWELLKKQYGNTCPCCHKSEPEIKLTEDHIIPLSKGGSDLIENIQPLCKNCNSKKYIKIIKF